MWSIKIDYADVNRIVITVYGLSLLCHFIPDIFVVLAIVYAVLLFIDTC